jgi:beta-lactamase superfamily II metal-dependent hydrolase
MKQVVFNVGGALSSYIEIDNKSILIDLGEGSDFNPIENFLLPLFKRRNIKKNGDNEKYRIDQLILSHPHNDHISAIESFNESFYPGLLTCPNDNDGQDDKFKVNWDLIENPKNDYVSYLRKNMLPGREPPLKESNPTNQFIYFIPPSSCELEDELERKNYANNTSIVVYFRINGTKIFMPGDLMKDGMKYLIRNNSSLRSKLKEGVDILIAPHHGLKSSFSEYLFDHMGNRKTRCINIVSEKKSTAESNRIVDSRYSSSDYCEGINNLSKAGDIVCQRKTSGGHIFINFSINSNPKIEIISDNALLIDRFIV